MSERTHLARLESLLAEAERMNLESQRELRETQDERAEEARSGRLGPEWQAIQRRIDAGVTTLADVFLGRDDSPEARRLVHMSRDNLERATEGTTPPDEAAEEMAAAEAQFEHLKERHQP
jgi:hypothetical protein